MWGLQTPRGAIAPDAAGASGSSGITRKAAYARHRNVKLNLIVANTGLARPWLISQQQLHRDTRTMVEPRLKFRFAIDRGGTFTDVFAEVRLLVGGIGGSLCDCVCS
jgi:hypothetical protein